MLQLVNKHNVCERQHCPALSLQLMVCVSFDSYNHLVLEHYNLCINIYSQQKSGM